MYKFLASTDGLNAHLVMFESLPIGSVLVDKKGHLIAINQTAVRLFNLQNARNQQLKIYRLFKQIKSLPHIMTDLCKGKDISGEANLVLPESETVQLNFVATMLCGTRKIFMFQFYK